MKPLECIGLTIWGMDEDEYLTYVEEGVEWKGGSLNIRSATGHSGEFEVENGIIEFFDDRKIIGAMSIENVLIITRMPISNVYNDYINGLPMIDIIKYGKIQRLEGFHAGAEKVRRGIRRELGI